MTLAGTTTPHFFSLYGDPKLETSLSESKQLLGFIGYTLYIPQHSLASIHFSYVCFQHLGLGLSI